jgi:hypothetical protein
MLLSPSEFFILGRIVAAWQTASGMPERPYWAGSLMDTVGHVLREFGLEHVGPPEGWGCVERRDAPDDTVWKRVEGRRPDSQPFPENSHLIPGVPTIAMGVSPTTPNRLFVERTDGLICAWIIEKPRSGLHLLLMRWLRPWAAVSPQLWLVMNERSWAAAVEEWRTLPEFARIHPHLAFENDQPDGLVGAAEQAAVEAGSERAFRLGSLASQVETELWAVAERANMADAFRRRENDYLGDPEEHLQAALGEAQTALVGEPVELVCRGDDGTIGFYEAARGALALAAGPLGCAATINRAIGQAHGRATQASSYLYGTFRSRGVA